MSSTGDLGALRILHLSDTHLFGENQLHFGLVDTTAALDAMLARCAPLEDLDLIVVSGDCSDDGSTRSYRKLAERIGNFAARYRAPVIYAMGNHDERTGFGAVLGKGHGKSGDEDGNPSADESPIDAMSTVRGWRLITLDTSVPGGAAYGALRPAQLEWLQDQLATESSRGTILVMHHPPVAARTSLLRTMQLQDPGALAEVIGDSDVRLMLAGHFHHQLASDLDGIPVIVAPGIANCTDPTTNPTINRTIRASGANLVEIDATSHSTFAFYATDPQFGETLSELNSDQIAGIAATAGSPDWRNLLDELSL